MFDLQSVASRAAGEMSPGYRQRLALACAIIHQPPVLFLDEPTSGVDPIARREFWLHIGAMADCGVRGEYFVTTHYMEEAEHCDRIGFIHGGRMIAEGTLERLKADVAARFDWSADGASGIGVNQTASASQANESAAEGELTLEQAFDWFAGAFVFCIGALYADARGDWSNDFAVGFQSATGFFGDVSCDYPDGSCVGLCCAD